MATEYKKATENIPWLLESFSGYNASFFHSIIKHAEYGSIASVTVKACMPADFFELNTFYRYIAPEKVLVKNAS